MGRRPVADPVMSLSEACRFYDEAWDGLPAHACAAVAKAQHARTLAWVRGRIGAVPVEVITARAGSAAHGYEYELSAAAEAVRAALLAALEEADCG